MSGKERTRSARDRLEQLLNIPSVAQFVYFFVVGFTGYIILRIVIRDGLLFFRSLFYMIVWFILIISTQPPQGAKLQSDPFTDPGIIPTTDTYIIDE